MSRRARRISSSGIYHVMLRGVNKQSIFEDDEDNKKFLQILTLCKELCKFELYGYCLMSNHVHLLLKETDETISQIIKRIASRYVWWFNKKYSRCGHLFQERYKSETVDDDKYFVTVLRYIHQNPVLAGICTFISAYKWSSYDEYIRKSAIIDINLALEVIGESNFKNFMNEFGNDVYLEFDNTKKTLTDREVAERIEESFGLGALILQSEKPEVKEHMCREILKIEGVSTRQLARVTGIPVNTIWNL